MAGSINSSNPYLQIDKYEVTLHICTMWVERQMTSQIKQAARERPCLLLTGARQTGKSSLLEHIFPHYNYVSLDLPSLASEAKENGSYFLERHKAPVIIDEIQYAPELFRFLKIEIDKDRKHFGRYLLTGSQKFSLMTGVSESLSGRISILECHSLSISEILDYQKSELNTKNILEWMVKGGYPELHDLKLKPHKFYSDYLVTYLERDVRQIINVKNLSLFDKFLRLLALKSGQVLSMNSLATDTGVSAHTIKSWVSLLEATNIIYLLKPFYNNYGKRLVKSPKLYFLDTGLLCFLVGLHTAEALENSALLGSFFETLVLGQLIRSRCNRGMPLDLFYFRDNHGNEIDFIVPEGDKLELIEAKWKHQSGHLPKNIEKLTSIVGAHNIKKSSIVTSSSELMQIKKGCYVTNLVEL